MQAMAAGVGFQPERREAGCEHRVAHRREGCGSAIGSRSALLRNTGTRLKAGPGGDQPVIH